VTLLLDFFDAAWPGLLLVWLSGVFVYIAWHQRPFLEQRWQEIRQGEWLRAAGTTALGLLAVLWWSVFLAAGVALVIAVIMWLVYRSGLGG
jgi:hypothetical protein